MGATGRLVFNPTDADEIAASSSVGAFVRSSDGTLIDHKTIATEEWLNVASALHAGDGTAITETGGALDVNIASGALNADLDGVYTGSNTDPDNVGLIGHDRAASPADTDQTIRFTGGLLADNLANTAIHAQDSASFLMGYDGTSQWDRLHQTDGDLHVRIENPGSINVNVTNDPALADTAIENTNTAVSLLAVNVVTSALANRKYLGVANEGKKSVYFGKTGVTAVNGFPLHPGERQFWRMGPSVTPQFIGGTGASGEDCRAIELS